MFDSIKQPKVIFERGLNKFNQKRYTEAIEDMDTVLKAGFCVFDAYLIRASCNLKLQRYREAINDCEQSLSQSIYIAFSEIIQSYSCKCLAYACLNDEEMALWCSQCIADYHKLYINECERYPLGEDKNLILAVGVAKRVLSGQLSVKELQKRWLAL